MKKFLLSCFLALGIGASAQYNYLGNFEETDVSIYGQFGTGTITAAAACSGGFGGQISPTAAVPQTGWMLMLDELEVAQPTQTNNSQAATVSIKYKKASGPVGTLYLTLFQYDEVGDTWSITPIAAGVSLTSAAITTCSTVTGTIPAGVLEAGKVYAVGAFYVRSSGTGNIYMDDISIVQDVVTTAPSCTTITAPANNSTIGSGMANIVWAAAPTATSYKLTVGTTAGGSDVYNGVITGGVTNHYVPVAKNSVYYAKVVPSNTNGDATGCTGIMFNTDNTVAYCTPTSTTVDEKFSKVVVADINQTTSSTAAYVDNTGVTGHVIAGKTYPITVTMGTGYTGDIVAVWIDANQNGAFEDGERTILTYSNSTKQATGNIAVPSGALIGNTRMRIRVDYQATPIPCGGQASGYGQAWDFTVNIAALALPSCTTITAPADLATGVSAPSATLTWNADTMADSYKVYVGTTAGGTNVVNGTVATTTSFALTNLSKNTTYYAKVVPTNTLGDATGCSEISFTTGTSWTYCTATHGTVNADRISNVNFGGINNPSSATTVTGGYEDFTSVTGNVEANGTYTMTVAIASGNANDRVGVWVDSNNNGTFETTEYTVLTTSGTTSASGNIAIPSNAVIGNTRMRVRLQRSTSGPGAANACGNLTGQGRTQDYTVNIVPEGTLAASDINKANVAIYPNPFKDVLRISDVKGVKSISVNDMSGRQVKTLAPSAEINLSSLKEGLYIVNLQMEDGSIKSFKAIKK